MMINLLPVLLDIFFKIFQLLNRLLKKIKNKQKTRNNRIQMIMMITLVTMVALIPLSKYKDQILISPELKVNHPKVYHKNHQISIKESSKKFRVNMHNYMSNLKKSGKKLLNIKSLKKSRASVLMKITSLTFSMVLLIQME